MRFLIRGADKNGNVANSVEIEQILINDAGKDTIINSYVQLRGSIPFQWTQEPNMTRNPKVAFQGKSEENLKIFSTHINELINKDPTNLIPSTTIMEHNEANIILYKSTFIPIDLANVSSNVIANILL